VRRSFIFKKLYTEGQKTYVNDLLYTRVFTQRLVNCSEGTFADLSWIYQDWNGNIVDKDAYIQVPTLKQSVPGTFADDVLKVACDGYSNAVESPGSTTSIESSIPQKNMLPNKMISENKNTSIFFKGSSLLYQSSKPYPTTGWIQILNYTNDIYSGYFFDNIQNGIGCKGRIKISKKNSNQYISNWSVDGATSPSAKCLESKRQYMLELNSSE
jgi:hypothetical protein